MRPNVVTVTDRSEDKRQKLQARKDVRLNSIGVRSQRAAILALRKYDRGFRKWWKTKAGVKQLSDITKVASDLAAASVALNTYAKGL